jgi:hypothetical protein
MPLEDFLDQLADIYEEAEDGSVPPQDALGAADRSDANWPLVATDVPCMVRVVTARLDAFPGRNDARAEIVNARVYFFKDPIEGGIGTRNRIIVEDVVYAVQGIGARGAAKRIAPSPTAEGHLFEIDCEVIKT